MSGLENRPTREVLTRQYEGIRPGNYYDEAYGDIFIACTYENGLYYPILGSASKASNHDFISQYYDNDTNVVVMKGVITANGYPTAIRKYNNPVEVLKKKLFDNTTEIYNAVTYYRTDVGVNFGAGEDVIDASRAVGRVTTKNYTKYLYNTSYTKGIGATVTYTGKTNLKTVVSSDYTANFVQSKSEYLIGQADDYGAISVLDEFSYFYLFGGQSFILLMLAFVTIIPVMINACGGAVARMLDIIALFIISPAIIATNSLYPDGKNAIYKKWKKNLETVAMGAFGYIIAFSSYTILIPMIYNVSSFVSVPTYNKIISLGGLGGFLTYPTVNTVVKFLWILTVVSVLEKVPTLVLPIITANRGDLKTPDPGLGEGMGKKFTSKLQDVVKSTTGEFQKIGNLVSGKALMGLAETAKDQLTDMIPGYNIVKGVVESKLGKAKDKRLEKESKEIEAALKAYGYDAKTAKKLGSAVKEADKQKQKAKLDKQKRIEQYKNDFKNLI